MRGLIKLVIVPAALLLALAAAFAKPAVADRNDDRSSVVIVFKDGHRQTFATAEIARIDLKAPAAVVYKDGHRENLPAADIERIEFAPSEVSMLPGRNHFVGKWEVGEGNGGTFYITLDADGTARKTLGPPHGTWTLVDGAAHIAWDDGWHDAIRKVGTKHEKLAYEPGKSFDDAPSNVTAARNTEAKPI
jgi:hypothetical protein